MNIYLYAKSGHTIGLDATKRCAVIANIFKDYDPILCTSDFRAGAFAKDLLGVRKYVNIDVIRNLPNIMNRKDILIFDTPEVNEEMRKDMEDFCSLVYDLNDDTSQIIVDKNLYSKVETAKLDKTIFYGDDDYLNEFLNMVKNSGTYKINLLMGHYFFLGNEKLFAEHFDNVIEEEEYVDTIQNSKYLLTGSIQAALESISCGNYPVLLKRTDKLYNEKLISDLNIPVILSNDLNEIIVRFEEIISNYPNIVNFALTNTKNMFREVSKKIETFNKLLNN